MISAFTIEGKTDSTFPDETGSAVPKIVRTVRRRNQGSAFLPIASSSMMLLRSTLPVTFGALVVVKYSKKVILCGFPFMLPAFLVEGLEPPTSLWPSR